MADRSKADRKPPVPRAPRSRSRGKDKTHTKEAEPKLKKSEKKDVANGRNEPEKVKKRKESAERKKSADKAPSHPSSPEKIPSSATKNRKESAKRSPTPDKGFSPYYSTNGTIKGPSAEDFDPEKAAHLLRKAFKGLGTDEKVVIDVICGHTNWQRQEIKKKYKSMFGRDLINDLEEETGGHFLDALLALMCPLHLYDAHCLRKAMAGAGTDESTLIEILCSRSNSEIELIKEAYRQEFGRSLEEDVVSETGSHFGRLLRSLLFANKNEDASVDADLADTDAAKLQAAGVKKLGTDEEMFNEILGTRSNAQLRLTLEAYRKRTGRDLEQDIRKEFSGDVRRGLLAIVKVGRDPVGFLTERIQETMKGAGTSDDALIRLLVSRSEVDLAEIKEEYASRYKKSLAKAVREDCSGDYGRLLLKVIG